MIAKEIIDKHQVDDGTIDHPEEKYYSLEELKEIFRVIECNLVMPFEGDLQTDNKDAKEIHRKITYYNREKFNELRLRYCDL